MRESTGKAAASRDGLVYQSTGKIFSPGREGLVRESTGKEAAGLRSPRARKHGEKNIPRAEMTSCEGAREGSGQPSGPRVSDHGETIFRAE